jgi:hypothetical protein
MTVLGFNIPDAYASKLENLAGVSVIFLLSLVMLLQQIQQTCRIGTEDL